MNLAEATVSFGAGGMVRLGSAVVILYFQPQTRRVLPEQASAMEKAIGH